MPFDSIPEPIPDAALILDRAADLVERGWCRGAENKMSWFLTSDKKRYCAVGALRQATADLDLRGDSFSNAVVAVQYVASRYGYVRVDLWNDAQWFRHPVVAGLREARDRVIAARRKSRVRELVTAAFLALVLLCGPAWAQSTPSGTPTINQGRQARLLVKSDSTVIPFTRGLFIGDATACNVALKFSGDTAAVTFNNVQSGALLPFSIKQLMSTGTNCTSVIALY